MAATWAKLPSAWIHKGTLPALANIDSRDAINALKLYMVVALFATFSAAPKRPAGTALLTPADILSYGGIPSSAIQMAVRNLSNLDLLTARFGEKESTYKLKHFNTRGWAKLPKRFLLSASDLNPNHGRLHQFSASQPENLNTLSIYLVLLAFRENKSSSASISYDRLVRYSGVPRIKIRKALNSLLKLGWLTHIEKTKLENDDKRANIYWLGGEFH